MVSLTDGMEGTVTQYSYNETGALKGTLAETRFREQGGADIQRIAYAYDTLARPVRVTEQRAGDAFTTTMAYDSQSRVSRVVHPTGVAVRYGYHRGYLCEVADDGGRTLWRTNETDALGSVVEYELGNGAVTRHTYDTATHHLKRIVTTKNLQSLAYDYDKFGNLAARKDIKARMEESFTYDGMDRLTGITLTRRTWQDLHCSVSYDALGRMTSRQAVADVNGTPSVETLLSAPSFDATKVHAMTQAQASPSFPSEGMEVTYTGFDKVGRVRQGGDSLL